MQSLYGWTDRLWRLVKFGDNWMDGWMDLNNRHFVTMFDNIWSIYPSIQVYIHVSIDPIVQNVKSTLFRWGHAHLLLQGDVAKAKVRCSKGDGAIVKICDGEARKCDVAKAND